MQRDRNLLFNLHIGLDIIKRDLLNKIKHMILLVYDITPTQRMLKIDKHIKKLIFG